MGEEWRRLLFHMVTCAAREFSCWLWFDMKL